MYIKDAVLPSLQTCGEFNADMIFAIHLQIICSKKYICVYIMFTNMSKFNAKVSIYTTSKYSQELVQTY